MSQPTQPVQRDADRVRDAHEAPEPRRADRAEDLHRADDLRKGVEKLVDRGDLRPNRVEEARQNRAEGVYDKPSVLDEIVNRLLEQWRIV
jgi:hypothetical protein